MNMVQVNRWAHDILSNEAQRVNLKVDVRLVFQRGGPAFTVFALELDDGECPVVDYLRGLKLRDKEAHTRMHSIIFQHTQIGPIKNPHISGPLAGRKWRGLLRFKTPQGARLLYFFLEGKRTILTNGYDKTDPEVQAYERARQYKLLVEEALRNGQLRL